MLNVKIKTAKISSEGEMVFSQKFGPVKISPYTATSVSLFPSQFSETCMYIGLIHTVTTGAASSICTYGDVRLVGGSNQYEVEWRCASMTSGGQCVMTTGTTLMQQ